MDEKKENESQIWKEYTRDIKRIDPEKPATETTPPVLQKTKPAKKEAIAPPAKEEKKASGKEIDRKTSQRLARGQIPIEGRLDLHGMTQTQAYDALKRFIPAAQAQGKRCILVITGKGAPRTDTSILESATGVLKQKTPEWLNSPPLDHIVLKTQTAQPKDGGAGALYVLLRRQR
ncbi:MAG: DNA mismatch repair protein MutS [Alphaproteobacteria bacterium]|nr:DNA mismatch repair protein MutS [Alphaproteobacteria bacterium]